MIFGGRSGLLSNGGGGKYRSEGKGKKAELHMGEKKGCERKCGLLYI